LGIRPEDIDATRLPHARVGGYSTAATNELLKQVAWDYRQLVHEKSKVVEETEALEKRIAELEQRVATLTAERNRLQGRQDLAAATLAAAQRAAHEAREDARRDCEQTLRAARRRAREIEQTMEKALAVRSGEIASLEKAQARLLGELRRVFAAALEGVDGAGSALLDDLATELGEAVTRAEERRARPPLPPTAVPVPEASVPGGAPTEPPR